MFNPIVQPVGEMAISNKHGIVFIYKIIEIKMEYISLMMFGCAKHDRE
jgi:hypothetical protein